MQCGAFFEVYGLKGKNDVIYRSNISDFSRICDLNVVDKKVCIGAVVAGVGALLTYLIQYLSQQDFGVWTPAIVSFLSILANIIRKLVAGR